MTVDILNANHVVVKTTEREVLFSYNTAVASKYTDGTVTLTDAWDYSRTTSKFRNQFLNETTADTRNKLISGEYKLCN